MKQLVTDLFFRIVTYIQVKRIIEKVKKVGRWLGSVHRLLIGDGGGSERELAVDWKKEAGLNDWRSPAYIFREKSDVFTGRSNYDISIKIYKVKNKFKK